MTYKWMLAGIVASLALVGNACGVDDGPGFLKISKTTKDKKTQTEIIAYKPRVFVPTDRPDVLSEILDRWPAQTILPAAA